MADPRVSVLMPVFDAARWVQAACRSILAQSFAGFELVVIDDGSRDGSADRVRELRDGRIRLSSRANRGLIATRNELLAMARAPLVAWMDADDVAWPDRLALQVARFDADPALVCLGSAVRDVDEHGRPFAIVRFPLHHDEVAAGLREGAAIRFPSSMMRTDAVRRVGGFRLPFVVGEDLDLFLRLHEIGRCENLPDVLLDYRVHAAGTSVQFAQDWTAVKTLILALADERRRSGTDRLQRGEEVPFRWLPPRRQWTRRDRWVYAGTLARKAMAEGFPATARHHAWRAVCLRPWHLRSWTALLGSLRRTGAPAGG